MKGAELADIGKYGIHERNVKGLNKCTSLNLLYSFLSRLMSLNLCREVLGLNLHLNMRNIIVIQLTLNYNCCKTMCH